MFGLLDDPVRFYVHLFCLSQQRTVMGGSWLRNCSLVASGLSLHVLDVGALDSWNKPGLAVFF